MSQVVELEPGAPPAEAGPPRAPSRQERHRRDPLRRRITGPTMVAPMLVVVLVFMGWPAIWTFVLSFTNMTVTGPTATHYQFIGLSNYRQLFASTGAGWCTRSARASTTWSSRDISARRCSASSSPTSSLARPTPCGRSVGAVVIVAWLIPEIVAAWMWYVLLSDGGAAAGATTRRPAVAELAHQPTRCSR